MTGRFFIAVSYTHLDVYKRQDASKTAEEPVTLKWYMSLNPVDADTDKVIAALNEYTKEKIGVTIDYTVIANPDYKEKMPTLINSGEYFDICFTADWTTNYVQFVAKDAFMDITDAVKQYAPETYEFIPESLWTVSYTHLTLLSVMGCRFLYCVCILKCG